MQPNIQAEENEAVDGIVSNNKPALTIKEFASLFGRSVRWGYDRVYKGEVKALDRMGVTVIPQSEIRKYLGKTKDYTGKRATKLDSFVE